MTGSTANSTACCTPDSLAAYNRRRCLLLLTVVVVEEAQGVLAGVLAPPFCVLSWSYAAGCGFMARSAARDGLQPQACAKLSLQKVVHRAYRNSAPQSRLSSPDRPLCVRLLAMKPNGTKGSRATAHRKQSGGQAQSTA